MSLINLITGIKLFDCCCYMWFPGFPCRLPCRDHVSTIANTFPLYLNNTRVPTERISALCVPVFPHRCRLTVTCIKRQGAVFVAVITFTDEWYFTWAAAELSRMSSWLHLWIRFPPRGPALFPTQVHKFSTVHFPAYTVGLVGRCWNMRRFWSPSCWALCGVATLLILPTTYTLIHRDCFLEIKCLLLKWYLKEEQLILSSIN